MEYCPVILKIESTQLQQYFGGEYLLQVYDIKGTCVFDKVLKYDVVSWNIFFNYFVFKLDDKEDGSGWFYIVKFKNGAISVIKVKDVFNDQSYRHIGLSQKHLFLANDYEIKIINFKSDKKGQEVQEITPKEGEFSTYNLGEKNNKLHGFFENADSHTNKFLVMIIENSKGIVDFAKMTFVKGEGKVSNINFQQYREVIALPNMNSQSDSIMYLKQYINAKEKSVAAVFRQSGKVDFYYDYELIDSTEGRYESMDMNSKYIFLKKKNGSIFNDEGEPLDNVVEIDHESAQRIGESVGTDKQLDSNKWHFIIYDLIRNHARIYTAITLVNTNFFVAFNKVVAIYDVVRKDWKSHFFFSNQVFGLLRNQVSDEMHELNVGVLLENGEIPLIDQPKSRSDEWTLNTTTKLKVEGKILKVVSDWRDISSHYIHSQLANGTKQLSGFQRNAISKLEASVMLKDDDQLIRCITPNEQEDFMLLNKKDKQIRTFTNKAMRNSDKMVVERFRKIKIQEIGTDGKNNLDILGTTQFHSAVGSKDNDYILLFSRLDLLRLKIEVQEQTIKDKKDGNSHQIKEIFEQKDFNIQNLQVIDSDYCYSLSNESSKQGRPGFYIQNVQAFINTKNKETSNFRLKAAVVGQNDLLDYYKDDQRIAYISSYDCIRIVPLLHRTVLGFIGMRPRNEYLAFRKFKDRLLALDKFGCLTTWSVITGKVLEQKTHSTSKNYSESFANFDIYQNGPEDVTYLSEWYQKQVLLFNKKEPIEVDQSFFYGDRLNSELGLNSSYVSTIQKKFYRFRKIEILESQEVYEHFSFIHPYYGDDKFQRLFFSDDLEYMLERHEQNVILYRKVVRTKSSMTLGSDQIEVTWKIVSRIKRFPLDLSESTFVNYLFSPNLMFYLDFNKSKNIFVIKNTIDQSDFTTIPQGLMNPGDGKDIALVGKKFQWLNNTSIRVVNNDGIEKTVDITKGCEQISYCSIPMLDLEYLKRETKSHFFYDISITKENQTIERLKRKYQEYFTAYFSNGIRDPVDLYDILFQVDFNIDNCKGKVVSDTSFTYFHWKIAELMESVPRFNIKRYHPEEIKILALNIFPKGNTVLHYAYKNLHIVQRFYRVIENEIKKMKEQALANEVDESQINTFEIPFMLNFEGNTPLHLCLDNQNYKSADIILQKLCNDPIDSHGRAINELLPMIVEAELPSLGAYLDSRFGQTQLLKDFRRGAIKKENDLEHGLTTSELWPDKNELKKRVFSDSQIDSEVKLEFLDVVGLHCYTEPVGNQFFDALSNTENLSLFGHRSVQAIIDFKYPLAKEYTLKVLLAPFCLYLATFVAWSNAFNNKLYEFTKETWYEMWVADKVLCAMLFFFSIYFLTNEFRQMFHNGISYFSQFWNYVDFVPSILIISLVSIKLKVQFYETSDEINIGVLSSVHSLASFLMWLKLLYFMRIFKQTGYLVKILTECIKDMKVFLFIFLTVIVAFNEAFLRIAEASSEEGQFQGKNYAQGFAFTFALAIGDTRADEYDFSAAPAVVWFIFCMVLLMMNVVMLNLLVAIISKSFEEINDNWEQTMYQERACIISENGYLIPMYRKRRLTKDKNQYLLIARELLDDENTDNTAVEQVQNKINEIEASLNSFKKEYREVQEEVSNQLNEIVAAVVVKKAA